MHGEPGLITTWRGCAAVDYKAWRSLRYLLWLLAAVWPARAFVQQQYVVTRKPSQDALNQLSNFPNAGNYQVDKQTWTNVNTNVRKDSPIRIEFAETIAAGIGYITFQPAISGIGTSTSAATTLTVPTDITVATNVLTVNAPLATVFAEATTYTVSFDAGVVQDTNVNPDTNAAFSVQFTTGDFTKPTQMSIAPAHNSGAVDTSSSIVITFSENVQSYVGSSEKVTVAATYQRAPQSSPNNQWQPACNNANIVISATTATVNLGASTFALLPCQKYQLSYVAKCFTDTSTNRNWIVALTSGSYAFWTSCITVYAPVRSTWGVPINTNIVMTFAEAVGAGTGNIVVTPLGESAINFPVGGATVVIDSTLKTVTLRGDQSSTNYICGPSPSPTPVAMQECKGKPFSVTIAANVINRLNPGSSPTPTPLPVGLEAQLVGSTDYKFTLKAADLTPPTITIVSMYGISETTIRVTVRLDESGTTYCRAYPTASFTPTSAGGSNVPTLLDCAACSHAIKDTTPPNFVGSGTYDSVKKYSEMEVDVHSLVSKTFYWVYCYSHDTEIPDYNTVHSSAMLATQRQVRTLDTTPPTFTSFSCVPTPGSESSITVTLSLNDGGRAYCKVVNTGFLQPSPNAVIAEGFFADSVASASFTIAVSQITTGLGATGMEPLFRKTDYDVYCWAQDDQGYPYHGPNGMVDVVGCPSPSLMVTTLDLTRPNMRFVMAESISKSQILITLQVDEGAKVWCAAWDTDPGITSVNYRTKITNNYATCMDNKGRQCGSFWVYDLDDIEDMNNALDGVSSKSQYEDSTSWKYNQDVDIIVYNLIEEKIYPYIYCFAEDDETDGVGSAPNQMLYDSSANSGPSNVYTIKTGIGSITTLDESPPTFTKLQMKDPTQYNDRIIVTFALNEAGTTYCRVHLSDSSETILRINRILTANYGASVTAPSIDQYITIDKLETRDTLALYEAQQYDVYCWAKDSALDTQGQPRPNYQLQDYVNTAVNPTVPLNPQGGFTSRVWIKDLTPPEMIYVSSEALSQTTIQITMQLNEPGTVWCQPVLPSADGAYLDTAYVTAANYNAKITGSPGSGTTIFKMFVHQPFVNVDVEVDRLERQDATSSKLLSKETPYNIYCFAEDDWRIEAQQAAQKSINFNYPSTDNVGQPNQVTYAKADLFRVQIGSVTTLDLTPPSISIVSISSQETSITVTLRLDETGTAWCQAVRKNFNVPTILEILDTNFYNTYTYNAGTPLATTTVKLTGYDRPKNAHNDYVTPLVLGTDYDVYCYADDDLCLGCKVTNGVSFSHVAQTKTLIRTLDRTRPNMKFIAAESIAKDQILVTLQVDEGAKVWCAAWKTDPLLTSLNYQTKIKNYAPYCQDNKGRQCGAFFVYDLDDLEDSDNDQMTTQAQYDADTAWKFNQDVDIILLNLQEETDYPYIYCYAEDDEATGVCAADGNCMQYSTSSNQGPDNVYTIKQAIGTVQTLDESPPTFTTLKMTDPTTYNDRIIVTFQLNEAGTTYCRVTLSDSGETTLRINQILSANYGQVQATDSPGTNSYITVDKLEDRDPADRLLYEAKQYDVYCWAKDSAVDTQGLPRPNYMIQDYVDTPVTNINAPSGGKTRYVWVKDTTPPVMIYVSSEALTQTKIQITMQLNEPGTVWCHPVEPNVDATYIDNADVTSANYISRIMGSKALFREYVPTPYYNVDVEVDRIERNDNTAADLLKKEYAYNIYCFAEDDWKIEATTATLKSINFQTANTATPNMTMGLGNEIKYDVAVNFKDAVGLVTTLDLTPPSITIVSSLTQETKIMITLRLDETGTAWCQAVRRNFNVPTILEILDTNFYNAYTYNSGSPAATAIVTLTGYDRPKNAYNDYVTPLVLGTDYDVYCYADDNLCLGCKVTNGVTFAHVTNTKTPVRTQDNTIPNMKYVAAESIAASQILVTLQVDEGAKVWCAAWASDPGMSGTGDMQTKILNVQANCKDRWGNQCGNFWVYDLDDIEDTTLAADGVTTQAEYDATNWKYNQDVDIIVHGLTEELDYPYIYCYAQDDETFPNKMIYNQVSFLGPSNVYSMKQEIGTVQTLDETPPTFTRLAIQDPTQYNDRIIVTFQLNEAGTTYCRTTLSDSGETTLRINQILTANYFAQVASPTQTGYITIDKLETRDTKKLYEALQYDIYCWAKDSAVDTQSLPRPNYDVQDYVQTFIGATVTSPQGGKTNNVWIKDTTPPTIIVVSREPLAEDTIQVTLQLNEPGTIWCQVADKDSSSITTTPGGHYCRDMDVRATAGTCYFENWIKGVTRPGLGSTTFRADVHVPYQDYDIDLNYIEKVTAATAGVSLTAQYHYNIWCFAEDDWKIQAQSAPAPSPLFALAPALPNKVSFSHADVVKDTIGQILTLDQTPPTFQSIAYTQYAETILTMTMTLNEAGTIWCMPVRTGFAEPSINEILQNNEYNVACGTAACTVAMQGLQSKTIYDIWCYTEDDNVYPQRPNGRKFTAGQKVTTSTLDQTPPILTIVSAESPVKTDIRIKIKMEEPGTVWCNSFVTGTSYGTITFNAVIAGGFKSYVGMPSSQTPGGPINTNVQVTVTNLIEETLYDTYCTAQDASTLPSVNKLTDPTTVATKPAIGGITTLDQSPPTFTKIGAKGINENTIQVTFKCNEACKAYCRVTRSDSGETSLSINRILKADFKADQTGSSGADQTIQLPRLENDASLTLLERGTLYDTYCWAKDEAVQHSCHAKAAGAVCETFPKPNFQGQVYVDTAFGGTPPADKLSPSGGKMLHVRTPDTTPPSVIFIEAESTEETSITVTLQLDEPGTAYCKAYTSAQATGSALFTDLKSTGTIYKNTVTNWNNIYKNFEVKVADLSKETKYYVYCSAEDDELQEGATTITPAPTSSNAATPILTEASGRFTLDLTPPVITMVDIQSTAETTATITLRLDEPGTSWCKSVRDRFNAPTINQIIAANFFSVTTLANTNFNVVIENLLRDTEYDVYCFARDRGTEVEYGITPSAGNPGNDVTLSHVLTTKRDIHTLGDSTPPIVSTFSPTQAATNVARRPIFEITFNEDIQASTSVVNVVFTTAAGGGTTISFDVTKVNNNLCENAYAKMSITLNVFRVNFQQCNSNELLANTLYFVSFAAGAFKDNSHQKNPVAQFGASSSYFFTTGATTNR